MSFRLTRLQRQLCNSLQRGVAICTRPFERVAEEVGSEEEKVIRETRKLREEGVIRRFGALINYRALGLVGTLVAAHVDEERLGEVAAAVSRLEEVSHNYERRHYYNLWFTLQGKSEAEIEATLARLGGRLGVKFFSLQVVRVFKLDVRFDPEGEQSLSEGSAAVPSEAVVELSERDKAVLSRLQGGLEIESRPFAALCGGKLGEGEVIETVDGLIERGVIRRIGAVVDHRKLGFSANVLFCCAVSDERVAEAGRRLARFGAVSHCYQRRVFEGWPYNLFAMLHGRSMGEVQRVISRFVEAAEVESFELLPTVGEFKKQPVRYRLEEMWGKGA